MGTLDCTFDSKASALTCRIESGVFELSVANDKMKGTLKLTDGRLYRNIEATKNK
jgi:hypothetical protein